MFEFTYQNPVKICFGNGMIGKTGEELAAFGVKKVLLVYGRNSIKLNGVFDIVTTSLKKSGIEFVEHGGVQSNPLLSHVYAGIEKACAEKTDALLAVGGGSVIDTVKAISLGLANDGDVWDFYCSKRIPEKAIPLFTVLTIPAAGSEMNGGTVITHDETREKLAVVNPLLYPKVSILDPAVTVSVPMDYTAYSASDAISHTIESYLTRADGFCPVQDGYAEGVVRAIMRSTERIRANPADLEARASMMWAATLAWNFLGSSGVGPWTTPAHTLEHPLSGRFNIAHGAGLAVTQPGWMAWELKRRPERVAAFARAIMGVVEADDAVAGVKGIELFRAWLAGIGCPVTLKACGIGEADIPILAADAVHLAKLWGTGSEYTEDVMSAIYRACI